MRVKRCLRCHQKIRWKEINRVNFEISLLAKEKLEEIMDLPSYFQLAPYSLMFIENIFM